MDISSFVHFGFDPNICHKISKRGVIFADASIAASHGSALKKALGYELLCVPNGEKHKTRETKQALEDELLRMKVGKDDVLISLGGGVTSDLVGFVASTYMRGAPLVLIPTTLLAMVDAAIGGKTGVNTPYGKNSVGTFYLPKAVFIDTDFLSSLPANELKNGFAEILKYGLIEDPWIWENSHSDLEGLIRASISCKIRVVSQDFEEKTGLRRILNFGHTIGHALEFLSNFEMAHGEAVALGCIAESYLSHLLGYLPKESLEKILQKYQELGYCLNPIDGDKFYEALAVDKKAKDGAPRFVLIDRIGHCVPFGGDYCRPVERNKLDKLLDWINHEQC